MGVQMSAVCLSIWFRALAEIVTSFVSLATSKEHPASLPHLKAKQTNKQTNKQTVIEWLDNTPCCWVEAIKHFFLSETDGFRFGTE